MHASIRQSRAAIAARLPARSPQAAGRRQASASARSRRAARPGIAALLEMGEKWRAAQGAGAHFIVYTDGSQGGEADMVRRMRVGQLNAALLSVVGLTEIDDSVAALQKMPLVFRSWDELDHVREKLRPALEKRFLDKGFVVLCWGDAGWVRFFSKEPALRPADYRRMKMFAWAGDSPQADIMKALGYQPVVLEVSDILPGLQTGMVNVVPSTPFWALTLQFYSHAPHMLDMNWAPIVGAVVITRKAWDAMSPAAQKALRQAGDAAGVELRAISRRENEESVAGDEEARPEGAGAHARDRGRVAPLAEQALSADSRPDGAGGDLRRSAAPAARIPRRAAGAAAMTALARRPRTWLLAARSPRWRCCRSPRSCCALRSRSASPAPRRFTQHFALIAGHARRRGRRARRAAAVAVHAGFAARRAAARCVARFFTRHRGGDASARCSASPSVEFVLAERAGGNVIAYGSRCGWARPCCRSASR